MNYNRIAGQYDSFEKTAVTVQNIGYPAVFRILGDVAGKKILDYGCGTGTFSRLLARQNAIVTGVDVSLEMINVAKQGDSSNIGYHHITSGDIRFLAAARFDHAVANFVLCTIPAKAEIVKIMKAIHHVLKEGGLFVIMNSNWERSNGKEFVSFRMEYCSDLSSGKPVTATIKSDPLMPMKDFYWSKDDYLDMLRKSGFKFKLIEEPLAPEGDRQWLNEAVFPPYWIIAAQATSSGLP